MTPARTPAPAWTLGIDVGGTKTAFCVARFPEGRITFRETAETPTGADAGAAFLARIARDVGRLLDHAAAAGTPCRAVGLSVCELVNLAGQVTSGHRVPWVGLPVREELARLAPAVVDADVRTAALAEARWGAGRDYDQFLYLNVGTGISSCWVRDGMPHPGARGNALALASSPIAFDCPHCGERGSYVLEDVAGGAGLAALYSGDGGPARRSAKDVLSAAAAGERDAQALIDRATRALGVSLGLAIDLLDPQAVVVGGGLGAAQGRYWDGLVRATREHIWSEDTRSLPFRPAALGADSALIGAAARAWLAGKGS